MNIKSLLPCALVLGAVGAQTGTLVYDNGPLQTHPGRSALQNLAPMSLNVYGFGCQAGTINNSCADDFAVNTALVINDIEVFLYQTGSTTTSTITAVHIEILSDNAGLPGTAIAGSPGIATPLTPNTNIFSGLYRDLESAPGNTQRPIMAVRVTLPTMLVLTPGIYWLQYKAAGSLTSGPWTPPITTLGQKDTGNGAQQIGLAGAWALVNSAIAPAIARSGFAFRLYGAAGVPGSIVMSNAGGCSGGTGIAVEGAPNAGGYIKATLSNVVGFGMIAYDFNLADQSFCGCTFDHGWSFLLTGVTTNTVQIPMATSFVGFQFGVQGGDLGAPGGCPIGFTITDGYTITTAVN